ncbi:hypothetical protein D5085_18335 [Ectothiorhodospiraceae bacterium BW-2]|nr:hypothetical protein D5085_18335 [Ectothiorhodospiraceae bacterium BW-2]
MQSDLFSRDQIRLAELSLCNWGSFHGLHQIRIDPQGTLITGDNGSGKSTLIDGLMALLLPAGQTSFNIAAAQGDRHDRSLVTYIRGSYGTAHDGSRTQTLYKRPGAVVTGVSALYRRDNGSVITLTALFWFTQSSHALSDLKRLYLVAVEPLSLQTLLQHFGEGESRQLKQRLRNSPNRQLFDTFSDYQECYCRYLSLHNRNAPALLSRALGLKKIDNLTQLIRDLVLEPSGVSHDARQVVAEFDDLVLIHRQLEDARNQRDTLQELPALHHHISSAEEQLQQLQAERRALSVYLSEQAQRLWQQRIDDITLQQQRQQQQIEQQQQQESDLADRVEQLHAAFLSRGSEQLQQLRLELDHASAEQQRIARQAKRYQQLAVQLELNPELEPTLFQRQQQAALASITALEQQRQSLLQQLPDTRLALQQQQRELSQLEEQIESLTSRPDSNIALPYQQFRQQLASELALEPPQLPYLGELIAVAEDQSLWQGAIERALQPLATRLLLEKSRYEEAIRWLNQHHSGLHITLQRVDMETLPTAPPTWRADGILCRLRWREHRYTRWLQHFLGAVDYHCVNGPSELASLPFSITPSGLIQHEAGQLEKRDHSPIDDQRTWQLGFETHDRLPLLQQDRQQLHQQIAALQQQCQAADRLLQQQDERLLQWQQLLTIEWDDIDLPRIERRYQQQQLDLEKLAAAEEGATTARQQWQEAKQQLKQQREAIRRHIARSGLLQGSLDEAGKHQQRAATAAATTDPLDAASREALIERIGELTLPQLDQIRDIEQQQRHELEQRENRARNRLQSYSRRAVAVMVTYRKQWPTIAASWGSDPEAITDYLQQLQRLEQEGLPKLVEQFRRRLTLHTTQSLANIRSRIEAEREDIADRINTINRVLARTEFRPGTHLRLGSEIEEYDFVRRFNRQLEQLLAPTEPEDQEAHYHQLQKVVSQLDKATANQPPTLESLRLLDPRYQLSFYAEEIDTDGVVKDRLTSSSGKSGGEKESFAGTIVAASLAYVLTPDGGEQPIYCTVFLDEAFSNSAEAVSRRVLRVFRELKLHVNLITPFKNLNLARESARSLIIVERDSATHESRSCEVTWEEIEKKP